MTTTPEELVQAAHRNQLALRYEVSALEAAVAAGHVSVPGQYAYALTWLAELAAERRLRDAAFIAELRAMLAGWQEIGRSVKDAADKGAA